MKLFTSPPNVFRKKLGNHSIPGLITILLLMICSVGFGQINMSSTSSYSQNFNTLITSGSATWTDNSTLANWYAQRTGSGTTIIAGDGSSNTGGIYSYGTGTNTDRALGSLGSGTPKNMAWGVLLRNTSGVTITSITVSYTMEQWRDANATAQTLSFYYLTSSSAITNLNPGSNGSWTSVAMHWFVSPRNNNWHFPSFRFVRHEPVR